MIVLDFIKDGFYDTLIALIGKLPDVPRIVLPDGFLDTLDAIFRFVGWLMPFEYYAPLLTFILGLTAFRIAYTIYLRFRKN